MPLGLLLGVCGAAGGEGGGTVAVCPLCVAVRWAETDYVLIVCLEEKKQTRGSQRVVENATPESDSVAT